jgi:uncharacterized membrane protein YidH (DUF202 family)
MPADRHLARRSFQAWVRTGLALLVTGGLITGISLGSGPTSELDRLLPWLGAGIGVLGVAAILGAVVSYRRSLAHRDRAVSSTEAPALILAGLVVIAGSLLAIILIADTC